MLQVGGRDADHAPPLQDGQNLVCRAWILVRHQVPGTPGRRHELHARAVDLLVACDARMDTSPCARISETKDWQGDDT